MTDLLASPGESAVELSFDFLISQGLLISESGTLTVS